MHNHRTPGTTGVVAGLVVSVADHPRAQFIRIAVVDIGIGDKVQIVFGGPDLVVAGDYVPVALPGARLPGRKKLRRVKFHDQTSYGMLCSAAELGWQPDGLDEVALLQHEVLVPGFGLDDIAWRDFIVEPEGWRLRRRKRWSASCPVPSGVPVAKQRTR